MSTTVKSMFGDKITVRPSYNKPRHTAIEISSAALKDRKSDWLLPYEALVKLADAINAEVERLRPKTKTQWRVEYGPAAVPSPTSWMDEDCWGDPQIDTIVIEVPRRIVSREVPA